jgi:hypothetical protein
MEFGRNFLSYMGPRVSLSVLLFVCGVVLLVAIALGNRMGNHVLVQVAKRTEEVPTPLFTPVVGLKDLRVSLGWKRTQLVSVATDPAFPDPRVAPPALPPAHARHHFRKHKVTPTPPPDDTFLPPLPPDQHGGAEEPMPPGEPGTPIPYETPQQ